MGSFEELSRASNGRPIAHKGRELCRVDVVEVEPGSSWRILRESTSSKYRQGVMLRVDGALEVNNRKFKGPVILWEDTAPASVEFRVVKGTTLDVRSVWDHGDGVTQFWHNGAAMFLERVGRERRYSCNDGSPDEDLDDIVFRLEPSE